MSGNDEFRAALTNIYRMKLPLANKDRESKVPGKLISTLDPSDIPSLTISYIIELFILFITRPIIPNKESGQGTTHVTLYSSKAAIASASAVSSFNIHI